MLLRFMWLSEVENVSCLIRIWGSTVSDCCENNGTIHRLGLNSGKIAHQEKIDWMPVYQLMDADNKTKHGVGVGYWKNITMTSVCPQSAAWEYGEISYHGQGMLNLILVH